MRRQLIVCLVPIVSLATFGTWAAETKAPKLSTYSCPPGFTAIAGTETCIKIGGQVRTEYRWTSQRRQPQLQAPSNN
jgi:hypothetical protein